MFTNVGHLLSKSFYKKVKQFKESRKMKLKNFIVWWAIFSEFSKKIILKNFFSLLWLKIIFFCFFYIEYRLYDIDHIIWPLAINVFSWWMNGSAAHGRTRWWWRTPTPSPLFTGRKQKKVKLRNIKTYRKILYKIEKINISFYHTEIS